jgi:hypothetical protein
MNKTLKDLTPHVAKHAFRALMPMFAHYWHEARTSEGTNPRWPDYERVLRACQDVLYYAPMHPNEARQVNAEARLTRSLERLATALAETFPGGLEELEGYIVTDAVREMRRARGLARYRRKLKARKTRSKRRR